MEPAAKRQRVAEDAGQGSSWQRRSQEIKIGGLKFKGIFLEP